ncbi:MAG: hypothetical protein ABSE25_13340 [Syntrophorhabdales bacterium]
MSTVKGALSGKRFSLMSPLVVLIVACNGVKLIFFPSFSWFSAPQTPARAITADMVKARTLAVLPLLTLMGTSLPGSSMLQAPRCLFPHFPEHLI